MNHVKLDTKLALCLALSKKSIVLKEREGSKLVLRRYKRRACLVVICTYFTELSQAFCRKAFIWLYPVKLLA